MLAGGVETWADERRIGKDEVGFEVGVLVVGEGIGRLFTKVKVKPTNRHIHSRKSPSGRIRLLPKDGKVVDGSAVLFDEFFT